MSKLPRILTNLALALVIPLWILVWLSPNARGLLHGSLNPWPHVVYQEDDSNEIIGPSQEETQVQQSQRYDRLLAKNPENKDLQFIAAVVPVLPTGLPKLERHVLDGKLKDPVVYAILLRSYSRYYRQNRNSGPLTNDVWPAKAPPVAPMKPRERQVAESAIHVGKLAQKLEPANAYFDWHLTNAYFQLGRDKEAIDSMLSAARKPGYNDHFVDFQSAFFRARSMEAPLSPSDLGNALGDSFQHAYEINDRMGAYEVMNLVIAAEARGDASEAVKLSSALMRVGRTKRLQSDTYIGALVGKMIASTAITSWGKRAPNTPRRPNASFQNPHSLPGYAISHGFKEIAVEAMDEYKAQKAWAMVASKRISHPGGDSTAPYYCGILERSFCWFTTSFAPLTFIWLVCIGFCFSARRRASLPETSIKDHALIASAGFAVLLALVAVDFIWTYRHGRLWDVFTPWSYSQSRTLELAGPFLLYLAIPLALIVCAVNRLVIWTGRQVVVPSWRDETDRLGLNPVGSYALMTRVFPILIRGTLWILTIGAVAGVAFVGEPTYENLTTAARYAAAILPVLGFFQLVALIRAKPQRGIVVRLATLLSSAISTYILMGLFLFPIAFLALAPVSTNFAQKFYADVSLGELHRMKTASK